MAFRRIHQKMVRSGAADDYSDDSLQDAFCRLWTRRDNISGVAQAEGLLSVTARNIRIDRLRSMSRHPSVGIDDDGVLPDAAAEDSAGADDIYAEVDRIIRTVLSERDMKVLHLRDRDGWEFAEIASFLGLSEGNVRMILSRARKTVRETYRMRYINHRR